MLLVQSIYAVWQVSRFNKNKRDTNFDLYRVFAFFICHPQNDVLSNKEWLCSVAEKPITEVLLNLLVVVATTLQGTFCVAFFHRFTFIILCFTF